MSDGDIDIDSRVHAQQYGFVLVGKWEIWEETDKYLPLNEKGFISATKRFTVTASTYGRQSKQAISLDMIFFGKYQCDHGI